MWRITKLIKSKTGLLTNHPALSISCYPPQSLASSLNLLLVDADAYNRLNYAYKLSFSHTMKPLPYSPID